MSKETHPDIRRTLVLLRREGELLLAMKKRGFGAGKWNGPGGKIEQGERLEHAMVREAQEEVGITPRHYWRVAELDFVQDADTDEPWHLYIYAYLCDQWEGEPTESEEMAPRWFALDDLPYDDMWDDDRYWLPRVLAGETLVGRFVFDASDQMTDHTITVVEGLADER